MCNDTYWFYRGGVGSLGTKITSLNHSTWNRSWYLRNWAVKKERMCFIIYDILDFKETFFGLCFFLTSKIASAEGQFDQGACNGIEVVLILIQIESTPSDQ